MEEVIRVREIRKSMEQSRFFTPVQSPMEAAGSEPRSNFHFPTSSQRNYDLYMTLDVTPDEPVRRKKSSGGGVSSTPSTPSQPRVLRNRLHESIILDDSTTASSSLNSSAAADLSTTPEQNQQRRVVHRRKQIISWMKIPDLNSDLLHLGKYKEVEMASASTQTSPGVLNLPSLQRKHYSLRSAQSPSTPGIRAPPPVVELSPDMFCDGSP